MNVCVYTLGCRLNQCESEGIADSFTSEGFNIVKEKEFAEIYIVNTCTVTSKAEQKARRMIRHFATTGICIVTGCYAQMNSDDIKSLANNIVIIPLEKKAHLLKLAKHINVAMDSGMSLSASIDSFADVEASVFDFDAATFSYHSRAYLKVQDGCDNNCGYCRVHVARGKAITLDSEKVIKRALQLREQGFYEIMLTGVNLTMYDHEGDGLGGLIEKLLAVSAPDVRYRLSSMEADHVDDRLLNTFKDDRIQPHFHIPLQSASDKVLQRANRKYDMKHLRYIIKRLKEIKDDPFIAVDVITGLPQEFDEEFKETYDFIKETEFSQLHVFPFSPRPNTDFENAKDKVPEYVRDERATLLRDLSVELHDKYIQRQRGKECDVIFQARRKGVYTGLTGNYLDVLIDNPPVFAKEGMLFRAKFKDDIAIGEKPYITILEDK
ncbi:MAG: tRNA (N(6)-L-threonylcarbamoyladenosine(37)-C(2))-methylthiotransferase MtaB [Spirochaetaceae bacterium]|nr:tRNA (N(6)-L-threonylcarbamoyladenosine(37)-C(2))-methylthiotransferase MtaB [Spirochaetaceae bacterium]